MALIISLPRLTDIVSLSGFSLRLVLLPRLLAFALSKLGQLGFKVGGAVEEQEGARPDGYKFPGDL